MSAAFLLTATFQAGRAEANPALVAAKVAQAASRAAQLGRAASAAGKASKLGKLGRIGTRVMRRVMAGRNLGPGGLKPNLLRLRMKKALKQRGLRNLQRLAVERNKNFRLLMKKRMGAVRTGARSFAQKQIDRRVMKMNRLLRNRGSAMRRMQSLQRKSRAESNRQDSERRRMMRSHASEMRRRGAQSGVFASAVLRHTGTAR